MDRFKRTFRAPPLRKRPENVLQFQKRPRWNRPREGKPKGGRWPWIVLFASPFAGVGTVWLWHSLPAPTAVAVSSLFDRPEATEQYDVRFDECAGPVRYNCVVDGDTFWLKGEKVRIADVNTPEVSEPQCAAEAELGAKATQRLVSLLNAGGFSLESADRDVDQYGRKLRIVKRDGDSLGEVLVNEGLAERWQGYRGSWC